MLEKQAHINDLSPKLRKKLEQRIQDFGDSVRYRFNISHPDPHPDNRGQVIWPSIWTLGPVTFQIMDSEEDRPTAQKLKTIGLVKTTDPEKGHPTDYRRIQVLGTREGYLQLDLTDPIGIEDCMLLELHPKHTGGLFFDKSKGEGVFQRIDELAAARANKSNRELRRAAMNVAADFSEKETRDFVSALGRDENRDIDILVEELAELSDKQPTLFTKEFNTGNWQWRATLKRALDKQILVHHPVEDKITMTATQETVAVLTRMESDTRSLNHRLADALQAQGEPGTKMVKRLEALVKAMVVA
jgi:hypothetical protein